jgi:hypothetical protein
MITKKYQQSTFKFKILRNSIAQLCALFRNIPRYNAPFCSEGIAESAIK